jgi:beta-phosphoglucomutase
MSDGGVVFDFDGVLADTERLHLRAFQEVFAPRGWHLDEAEYFERWAGYSDRDVIAGVASDRGAALTAGALAALLAEKSGAFANAQAVGAALFPGVRTCVAALARQYPLAIASGSLRDEIQEFLDRWGLGPAFTAIVGADDVAAGKPAPDPYLAAVRLLGVAPGRAVAVEDTTWGLESARRAGLRTVAVTHTYSATVLASAEVIISTLHELTPAAVAALLRGT